jgi:hypothetical protein
MNQDAYLISDVATLRISIPLWEEFEKCSPSEDGEANPPQPKFLPSFDQQ